MNHDTYFRWPRAGTRARTMRSLLEREASLRARRFGMDRRSFLESAMGALAASAVVQQMPQFRSIAEAQTNFSGPSEDCYAATQAANARFRRADAASELDWSLILTASRAQQAALADTVLNMLNALATLYGGFGVSELTHMTQTATRASRAGASDELILLALLHDVGDAISGINHAEIVAALVRPYVSAGGYALVRTHMEFQLKHYGDEILQPTDMRERYAAQAWYADAVRFSDEWDQASFDPDYDTLPLVAFEPLLRATFAAVPEALERTARDCLPAPRD